MYDAPFYDWQKTGNGKMFRTHFSAKWCFSNSVILQKIPSLVRLPVFEPKTIIMHDANLSGGQSNYLSLCPVKIIQIINIPEKNFSVKEKTYTCYETLKKTSIRKRD